MKNNFWNRLLSIGIVIALLFGVITIPSASAQVKPKPKPTKTKVKKGPGPMKNRKFNADIALLVKHLTDRHIAGFPGGKSKVEETFSSNLAKFKVSNEYLRTTASTLDKSFEKLQRQAKNPDVKQLTTNKAASLTLIKKLIVNQPGPIIFDKDLLRHKYQIRLQAIKSMRCADDLGPEWWCDAEEPYIIWSAFSPGFARIGRTDSGSNVKFLDEYQFNQDKFILGSDDSGEFLNVEEPLVFVYQVMEEDIGVPTSEQVRDALGTAASTTISLFAEDWTSVISNEDKIKEIFDTAVTIAGAFFLDFGDDAYPVYTNMFNSMKLYNLTNGTDPLPENDKLFDSDGNYPGIRQYIVDIKDDEEEIEWKLAYQVVKKSP